MATAADAPTTQETRARLISGLLDLADFLADHPTVPLPHVWATAMAHTVDIAGFRSACEEMLPAGATVADGRHGNNAAVTLSFGPIDLSVEIDKDKVGEKVTTTREVTEYVLPEWATVPEAVSS